MTERDVGAATPGQSRAGEQRAPRTVGGLRCRGLSVTPGDTPVLVDVDLTVTAGTLTVLVGPSGVGKTTLLRAIAGLAPLSGGTITLAGRDLTGVTAHRRNLALVFQEPRLFPNLDAAANVAFGLRTRGVARDERRTRAGALLTEVGLDGFDERSARSLSGGEAQRVALARALSVDPDLLLLDEPLSAVDPNRREGLRDLIRRLQRQRQLTTVYVTHDRAEAAELGDEVALMLAGDIVAHDSPGTLFERPVSAAAARFLGANVITGEVRDGRLRIADGAVEVGTDVGIDVGEPDGPGAFAIRPERIIVGGDGPVAVRVNEAVYTGSHVRLTLEVELGAQSRASADDGPHSQHAPVLEAHVLPEQAPSAGSRTTVTLPNRHLWRLHTGGTDR